MKWKSQYFYWNRIDSILNIPEIKDIIGINSFLITKSNEIYASINSNTSGVLKSIDSCKTWIEIYKGLNNSTVNDLCLDSNGILYAGTDKGIYKSSEIVLSVLDSKKQKENFDIDYNQTSNSINLIIDSKENTNINICIVDIQGKIIKNLQNIYLGTGKNYQAFDLSSSYSGLYYLCCYNENLKIVKKILFKR